MELKLRSMRWIAVRIRDEDPETKERKAMTEEFNCLQEEIDELQE